MASPAGGCNTICQSRVQVLSCWKRNVSLQKPGEIEQGREWRWREFLPELRVYKKKKKSQSIVNCFYFHPPVVKKKKKILLHRVGKRSGHYRASCFGSAAGQSPDVKVVVWTPAKTLFVNGASLNNTNTFTHANSFLAHDDLMIAAVWGRSLLWTPQPGRWGTQPCSCAARDLVPACVCLCVSVCVCVCTAACFEGHRLMVTCGYPNKTSQQPWKEPVDPTCTVHYIIYHLSFKKNKTAAMTHHRLTFWHMGFCLFRSL